MCIGMKVKYCYWCPRLIVVGLLLSVAACSNTQGPVNIRDLSLRTENSQPSVQVPQAGSQGAEVEVSPTKPKTLIVKPVEPVNEVAINQTPGASASSPVLANPLTAKILQQAQQQLKADDISGAIVSAERGLRVDRREPEFYAVLAEAYSVLNNRAQSIQFAKQGLRYAPKGSSVWRRLSQWSQ